MTIKRSEIALPLKPDVASHTQREQFSPMLNQTRGPPNFDRARALVSAVSAITPRNCGNGFVDEQYKGALR
jgi:hypothetical protein